jgi:hypothetical protein
VATATSKGLRSVAAVVEPQQVVAALTAAMTTAVTAPSIPPVTATVGGCQAAVVEILDDDTPPPGWDQWGNLPALAPEPPTGVLVIRDDGGVMSGRPVDGVEASSSRAVVPASDGAAACPEQERECADAPLLMVKIRQPSHEFTFGVGITFVSYPLVLTPVV